MLCSYSYLWFYQNAKIFLWWLFPKLHPIVTSIGTFNYNLVRYLCDLLSPLIPRKYFFKDTFSFISQIKNLNLIGKLDLTSLFINIPFQELSESKHYSKEFKKLFLFATWQNNFLFKGKFYNHIDGVSMNSPLVPTLIMGSPLVMIKWMIKWMQFYLKYVNDVLAVSEKEQDSLNFWNIPNKKHLDMKFTTEKQVEHSIAVLDVYISGIDNQNITLQICHHSTYPGVFLNFKSFTSYPYFVSLIKYWKPQGQIWNIS